MYARSSQQLGRLRLRHLLEVTEAEGENMATERERFERLADPGSRPRVVSSFNLFQTPEPLAARMASLLTPGRTLEPSAGLGRLYRAVRAAWGYETEVNYILEASVEIPAKSAAENKSRKSPEIYLTHTAATGILITLGE